MVLVVNNENGRLRHRRGALGHDLIGIAVMTVIAAIGYFAFPDNLALLTRMITIALLVLSLDLVTGYCGVATLGHDGEKRWAFPPALSYWFQAATGLASRAFSEASAEGSRSERSMKPPPKTRALSPGAE